MSKICLVKIPYDSGHFNERKGKGPAILGDELIKYFNAKEIPVQLKEVTINDLSFVTEIASIFELNRRLVKIVQETKDKDEFPVILSGNCNSAIGTISGLRKNTGIIWFDCHGDFNTPDTTIGGLMDGMSLAIVAGRCWKSIVHSVPGFSPVAENKIILVGARDLDDEERENLKDSNIKIVSSGEIRAGLKPTEMQKKKEPVYVHIDLDILDPKYVKANTNAVPGGLSPVGLKEAIIEIKNNYSIEALSFASYDPSFDPTNIMSEVVTSIVAILMEE